jgi:hypothetical protein
VSGQETPEPLRILGRTRAEFREMARELIDEVLQEPEMQERLREAGYDVRPRLTVIGVPSCDSRPPGSRCW